MYWTTKRTTKRLYRLGLIPLSVARRIGCDGPIALPEAFLLDDLLAECRKREWPAQIYVYGDGASFCEADDFGAEHNSNPAEALGRAMILALKAAEHERRAEP